jgi:sugar lactone lactonase YvrE
MPAARVLHHDEEPRPGAAVATIALNLRRRPARRVPQDLDSTRFSAAQRSIVRRMQRREVIVARLHSFALPAVIAVTTAAIPIIPTLEPPLPPTSGIVAAADGTIYFVDSFHSKVWRVEPGREPVAFVAEVSGGALQLGPDGDLFGTHEDAHGRLVVWRADARGRVSTAARPELPGQYGHAFTVTDAGDVIAYTGTGRRTGVRVWRAGGGHRHLLAGGHLGSRDGVGAAARFQPIGGMTRTTDGALLVTSGSTIRRIEADGTVSTIAAGDRLLQPRHAFLSRLFGDTRGHLSGIAVADDGSIYVANPARGAVVRIGADGSVADLTMSPAAWSPTGVTVVGDSVCILEYGAGVRVRCVAADGRSAVVAMVRPGAALFALLPAPGRISRI